MDRLDELALLVAILDGGTLAAGARKTRRSPAAVTRILGELEGRLGVRPDAVHLRRGQESGARFEPRAAPEDTRQGVVARHVKLRPGGRRSGDGERCRRADQNK